MARSFALVVAGLGLLAAPSLRGPAHAVAASATVQSASQTDAEASQRRITELEAELAAAKKRIADLERALATYTIAAAPTAAIPTDVTADAALSSLNHFLAFARNAYATEFGPTLAAMPPLQSGDVLPVTLQRQIERWSATMTREWRKPIRWLVRHGRSELRGDALAIRVNVIDEATGDAVGDEFEILLDAKQTRRYFDHIGRMLPQERWTLQAVFVPRFIANLNRVDMGVFDSPPFIGPGSELREDLVIESFSPARLPKARDPAAPIAPANTPAPPAAAPPAGTAKP